jgi:hypothetical protein
MIKLKQLIEQEEVVVPKENRKELKRTGEKKKRGPRERETRRKPENNNYTYDA